jgi:ribosomal protein S18 acetylase RimI-like enzyme
MLNIRQANNEDIFSLARVHVQSWHETYTGLMPQSVLDGITRETRETQWQRTLSNPRMQVFVAALDGVVVGFTSLSLRESEAHAELFTLYVLKAFHRQGIGLKLWNAVLEFLELQNSRNWCCGCSRTIRREGFMNTLAGLQKNVKSKL